MGRELGGPEDAQGVRPLTATQRDAAERLLPAARSMVARFIRRAPWLRDDLIASSQLAACYAARTYRVGGGRRPESHLWEWVRCCADREISRARGRSQAGRGLTFDHDDARDAADPHDDAAWTDEMEHFERVIATLPERLQRIVWLRFVFDMTRDEIGLEMGVGGERIKQLTLNAFRALRPQLCSNS